MQFEKVKGGFNNQSKWECGDYQIHRQTWFYGEDGGSYKDLNYVVTWKKFRIHNIHEQVETLEDAIAIAEKHNVERGN